MGTSLIPALPAELPDPEGNDLGGYAPAGIDEDAKSCLSTPLRCNLCGSRTCSRPSLPGLVLVAVSIFSPKREWLGNPLLLRHALLDLRSAKDLCLPVARCTCLQRRRSSRGEANEFSKVRQTTYVHLSHAIRFRRLRAEPDVLVTSCTDSFSRSPATKNCHFRPSRG